MGPRQGAQRPNLRYELTSNCVEGGISIEIAWFGDVVRGSEGEGFECYRSSALRQSAEHDDGHPGVELAQLLYGFNPIHLGNFNIKEDDVQVLAALNKRVLNDIVHNLSVAARFF